MSTQILFYTGLKGKRFEGVTVERHMSEGYPTGELSIRGLTREHLQSFADWALTLPADQYAPVESAARATERYLMETDSTGMQKLP